MVKRSRVKQWYIGGAVALIGFIILGVTLSGQAAQQPGAQEPTQAPTSKAATPIPPTPTPAPKTVNPFARPYSDDSPWNTPIGADPRYDPNSSEMIATIASKGVKAITSDPAQYSYPVYYVDQATPRWDVPCLKHRCTIVRADGVTKTDLLKDVPIPAKARESTGSDGQMIIIDKDTGAEYNLWQVQQTATGWSASNASVYNIFWDAKPEQYGSRGAGVPYLAGLVRPWEIEQGRIDHALAFGYPTPARDRCVFPASKTDGKSKLPFAIPEGARIQLDPKLTDADFDRMGLDRTGKIIARALQTYGMYLIDISGRPKIYVENLDDNPLAALSWGKSDLKLTSTTISGIPLDAFHVLVLPESYWDKSAAKGAPMHGKCFAP